MTFTNEVELRRVERTPVSINASVKAREDENSFWKEDTSLINVSRAGASFYADYKCQVGQLVSLLFPMPKNLRLYDQDEINYRVWGLVQHCNAVDNDEISGKYYVGVAFIGKSAPISYYQNPRQTYRISGVDETGLWKITENERPFVNRKDSRFPIPLEVTIRIINDRNIVVAEEETVTENISFGGAAVLSSLSVETGGVVSFNCQKYDFSSAAIVRNKNFNETEAEESVYKHSKLHLEFTERKFPLEQVKEI
jgi:hypothetical protein